MLMELSVGEVERRIHIIRGQKVMLDRDLAYFYQVKTSNLNKAVRRNSERFPEEFMFQLTRQENERLIFQIGISKRTGRGGLRKLPNCFTQEGVAMLSSVLNSDRAVQVNIAIMKTFVHLRRIAEHANAAVIDLEAGAATLSNIDRKLDEILFAVKAMTQEQKKQARKRQITQRLPHKRPHNGRVDLILNLVAQHFGFESVNLENTGRHETVVLPRQIAMYLIKKHEHLSYRKIGDYFGGRDHTTVLHACRQIEEAIEKDKIIKELVDFFEKALS